MDVVNSAYGSAAVASSAAPAFAFAAGVASSFGPCVAARILTVSALCAQHRGARRWIAAGVFAAGICAGYTILGTIAGAAGALSSFSPAIYRTFAVLAITGGIWTIVRPATQTCCAGEGGVTNGVGFLAGLASATVTSPCCGPIGAALAGVAAASAGPQFAAEILAAFALGHVLPIAAVAGSSIGTTSAVARVLSGGAGATISGAIMLAAGGYYAVLA